MQIYAHHGFNEFILCLGYKSDVIKDYFLNYRYRLNDFTLDLRNHQIEWNRSSRSKDDWKITFAETGLNALTGARIYKVQKYVQSDDYFMLTYGDGVSNVNIEKLVRFHKSHGKLITVTAARPTGRFGELEIDGSLVTGFNEKPQTTEGWISSGFFVCSRKILDYLTPNENLVFEKEPISHLVKDQQMMVFKHEGFWHPMDTSRDYQLLNQLWSQNQAPWKIWNDN